MIGNKLQTIVFLNSFSGEDLSIKKTKNVFVSQNGRIGIFWGSPSPAKLETILPEGVWITPNYRAFKKNLLSNATVYLLRKEKKSYFLYDRRYVKTKNGLYLLPPVELKNGELIRKTFSPEDREETFFFPKKTSSFYLKGDFVSRLGNPDFLKNFKEKPPGQIKIFERLFLYAKRKLDS